MLRSLSKYFYRMRLFILCRRMYHTLLLFNEKGVPSFLGEFTKPIHVKCGCINLSHLLDNRCSLFLRDLSWSQLMWDGVYWLMNNLHWFPAKTERAHYWIEYNDSNFITQIFSIWTMNEISKKQKKIYSWWRILPFIFSHHIFCHHLFSFHLKSKTHSIRSE